MFFNLKRLKEKRLTGLSDVPGSGVAGSGSGSYFDNLDQDQGYQSILEGTFIPGSGSGVPGSGSDTRIRGSRIRIGLVL